MFTVPADISHVKPPCHGWRLIEDGLLPGERNMAIDEALLNSFNPVSSAPVLRLYGWSPPALSLGRFQKAGEVLELERCNASGTVIVRRITGGGVIYHAEELTYSIVCAPDQIPPATSVKDSFRVLTSFLLAFYRQLGLDSCYAVDAASEGICLGERTAFCFAGRESFDIVVNGRKIGGNAQRRLKNCIFQHGSIPLLNMARVGLSFLRDRSPELAEGAGCLAECGITIDRDRLQAQLIAAFEASFGVVLSPDHLSSREQAAAERLYSTKYTRKRWNLEGIDDENTA
ncbi:lipoate--protein ligase family protein [Geobacter chapellei]|uniref:Lipoate--protein ligase family protein n=2 Tax=Pelotalea chapellei TaxID=44671 RepID=A0ABS5U7S0_9BACT|nr:lipoate--protein ligase family protein [Pelotalea chapellei]